MPVSKDELAEDIQRVAETLGKTPTVSEYNKHGEYSHMTAIDRFGSWNDAVESVDLKPNQVRRDAEEYLEDIRRVAEKLGDTPFSTEYDEHGEYRVSSIRSRFGSWTEAVEEAGLEPKWNSNISTEDLVQDIRRVADELGETPTRTEYDEHGEYSSMVVWERFGRWDDALEEMGLEPPERENVSKEEVIEDIRGVAETLGETPTRAEYQEHGEYSRKTPEDKFGSWQDAVEAAGLEPRYHSGVSREDAVEELRRLGDELGRRPTQEDVDEYGRYGSWHFQINYDWCELLEEAGFDVSDIRVRRA